MILPDGRRVRGRGVRLGQPLDDGAPEFGVHLTGRRYEAAEWTPVWVRWPDVRLPKHPSRVVDILRQAHREAAERRVEIGCGGRVGRPGTAIAILARLAGVSASEAVTWTRANYQAHAVETPQQRRFVLSADSTDRQLRRHPCQVRRAAR